jgi:glycyl-tRNA synthetase
LTDAHVQNEPEHQGRQGQTNAVALGSALAPVKVAVLPLSRHADLSPTARDLPAGVMRLPERGVRRRRRDRATYRRRDEIGTPLCVTTDVDTLNDRAVTIRERNAMSQDRIASRRSPRYD